MSDIVHPPSPSAVGHARPQQSSPLINVYFRARPAATRPTRMGRRTHGMAYGVEQAETAGRCGRPRSSYLADPNASSTTSLRSAVHRSGTASSNPVRSSEESANHRSPASGEARDRTLCVNQHRTGTPKVFSGNGFGRRPALLNNGLRPVTLVRRDAPTDLTRRFHRRSRWNAAMPNDAPAACAALFEELADIVFGHPIDACVDDFLHRLAVVKRKQRVHRLLAHLEGSLSHERGDIALFEELQLGG